MRTINQHARALAPKQRLQEQLARCDVVAHLVRKVHTVIERRFQKGPKPETIVPVLQETLGVLATAQGDYRATLRLLGEDEPHCATLSSYLQAAIDFAAWAEELLEKLQETLPAFADNYR